MEPYWEAILGANLVASFVEGGLGFGGSLIFLALTLPLLGWSDSLLADCFLGGTNLLFVAFLHRRELPVRPVVTAWFAAVPATLAGALVFVALPPPWRVLPFVILGLVLILLQTRRRSPLIASLAGLGVGLSNSDAPFGFLYFAARSMGPGPIALFAAGLLLTKAIVLMTVWDHTLAGQWAPLVGVALLCFPASIAGRRAFATVSDRFRQRLIAGLLGGTTIAIVWSGLHV